MRDNIDYALLSTTSLSRVRGFTINLLFHLKEGPKRCCDLAEITEKTQPYVDRYLRNMRNYGLVEKQGFLWQLSILGEDFFSYLSIVYNNIIEYRKKKERKKKEERKIKETSHSKVSFQASFDLWLQNSSLHDTEKEVVELLCKHYEDTGSKFVLIENEYELAKKINKNPQDIRPALANLRQENIIYLLRDHDFPGYHKLGLKKAFMEAMQKEGSS